MPVALIDLFADLYRTAQLHNQIRSTLAVRERDCDRRWRQTQTARTRDGENESTEVL